MARRKQTSARSSIRVKPAGERAVVLELGNAIEPKLNARVRALDRALLEEPFAGYVEAIPTYRSLLVFYEPSRISFEAIEEHARRLGAALDTTHLPRSPLKTIPVVYDGEDLDDVARLAGISRDDVIELHSGREYLVYMVGFTPGFAYMGSTDDRLALPRRSTPRTRVPAGAVAIAMGQTGIYPSPTPGGWHLLGRAEHGGLFDVDSDTPSFFRGGDRVRFVPVTELPPFEPAARRRRHRSAAAALVVEDGGLLTTIQDGGRRGFRRYGVPVAGAVDAPALRRANRLVGNDPEAAGLECSVQGPRLRALEPVVAAMTGPDLGAFVERADLGRWPAPRNRSFLLRPGNTLGFDGESGAGARAYLAFAGGIDVPVVLGSRATYLTAGFGGLDGRALVAGDELAIAPGGGLAAGRAWPVASPARSSEALLRVVWGPQEDYFTATGRKTLVTSTYSVAAASDRMGYRLEGPTLRHAGDKEIVSDGMMPGGIQVPPNGLPIVMLADGATTGGYPKIATVIGPDIAVLGQLLPGDLVRFQAISLEAARKAARDASALEEIPLG